MSTNATDYEERKRSLEDWLNQGDDLKRALKDGRIHELLAQGERVTVRPIMVEQPGPGHVDMWFGLSYYDWRKFRAEGFDGWMETTTNSLTPKIMIWVEKAERWLEERCRKQWEAKRNGTLPKRRRGRPVRKLQPAKGAH